MLEFQHLPHLHIPGMAMVLNTKYAYNKNTHIVIVPVSQTLKNKKYLFVRSMLGIWYYEFPSI